MMYTDEQIRQMIDDYKASNETVDLINRNGLVVFVGVTGAGKNSIMNELVKTGKYHDAITSTTRLPRENDGVMEVDGVDYHFLTTEQAVENIQLGKYAEVSWVHNRINGILAEELKKDAELGKITITDIDIQGALKCRRLSANTKLFFIVPPSFEEWDRRNRSRYRNASEFEKAWPDRKNSASMEIRMALDSSEFLFVLNTDISATSKLIRTIIEDDVQLPNDDVARSVARQMLQRLEAN